MASVLASATISEVTEAAEGPSLTYGLDLEKGRIHGKVDGIAAIRQAIAKAVLTPRFKCLIYSNQYGCEAEQAIIAEDATPEYVEAAAEGFVRDALLPDTRVLSISGFSVELSGDEAVLSFTAETVFGTVDVREEI